MLNILHVSVGSGFNRSSKQLKDEDWQGLLLCCAVGIGVQGSE